MLLNPFSDDVEVIDGTPFIQDPRVTRYLGARILLGDPRRSWSVQGFFTPSKRRGIQGIRARLQDQKGFSTFCNQRDLEVLLGLGTPNEPCYWLGRPYRCPSDSDWYGFCVDELDLWDDLYERELFLRPDLTTMLPEGTSITRRIHIEPGLDVEETWCLLRDYDAECGLAPDPRYRTVTHRWVRAERTPCIWELMKTPT